MTQRRSKRTRLAFSLSEILIVIAILSVAILGTFSCFAWGVRAGKKGGRVSEATNAARELIEVVRVHNLAFITGAYQDSGTKLPTDASGFNDAPSASPHPLGQSFPYDPTLKLPQGNYRRMIRMNRVSPNSSDWQYNVIMVTTTVYWDESAPNDRSVTLNAFVNDQ